MLSFVHLTNHDIFISSYRLDKSECCLYFFFFSFDLVFSSVGITRSQGIVGGVVLAIVVAIATFLERFVKKIQGVPQGVDTYCMIHGSWL